MGDNNQHLIGKKTHSFSQEEMKFIRKARKIIKERGLDVSGLEESIRREETTFYVVYLPPGHHEAGGGGWYVEFEYPSGKVLRVAKNQ